MMQDGEQCVTSMSVVLACHEGMRGVFWAMQSNSFGSFGSIVGTETPLLLVGEVWTAGSVKSQADRCQPQCKYAEYCRGAQYMSAVEHFVGRDQKHSK